MRLMRKTGARLPWQPAPLFDANTDPNRPTIIVPGWQPLVPAQAIFVGRPAIVEDVNWPARPAVVRGVPVPVPGASIWKPEAARLPSSDPSKAPLVIADQPDATLVQPNTTWVGGLRRAEDTNWPARPAVVVTSSRYPQPVVVSTFAVRDPIVPPPDALRPTTIIQGQQPVPDDLPLWVGQVHNTPTDRPAVTSVIQSSGRPPVPGLIYWSLAPRTDDRPGFAPMAFRGDQPIPGSAVIWLPKGLDPGPAGRPPMVLKTPFVPPAAQVVVPVGHIAEPITAPKATVLVLQPVPLSRLGAIVAWLKTSPHNDPTPTKPATIYSGGLAGFVLSDAPSGNVEGPDDTGRIFGE